MLAFLSIGGHEWIIILIIALLLFGRRLPEVMRSLGRGIVEFKKGVRGIEDQIEEEASRPVPPPEKPSTSPSSADSQAPQASSAAQNAEEPPK